MDDAPLGHEVRINFEFRGGGGHKPRVTSPQTLLSLHARWSEGRSAGGTVGGIVGGMVGGMRRSEPVVFAIVSVPSQCRLSSVPVPSQCRLSAVTFFTIDRVCPPGPKESSYMYTCDVRSGSIAEKDSL